MKREQIALTLILAGATAILCAGDIRKDDEAGAAKLANYLRGAGYYGIQYSVISDKISAIVEAEDIPRDVYVATVEKVADEFIADTFVHTNYSGKAEVRFKRDLDPMVLVGVIGTLGDPGFLPWLERKTAGSDPSHLRERAATSYVKIAGLDAVPFVRKILSRSEDKYDIGCKRVTAKEFFEQIAKAKVVKAPQEKLAAAYAMLVEQAQNVAYVGHADQIDRFLNENLEGYRSSVQREKIIARFVDSTNEFARANFRSCNRLMPLFSQC